MKTVLVPPLHSWIDVNADGGQVDSDAVRGYLTDHEIEHPAPGGRLTLAWPVAKPVIVTQTYGIHKEWYAPFGLPGHEGIDIRSLTGTPVMACADGAVSRVEKNAASGPYGIHVRLRHKVGADEYETIYAHFKSTQVAVAQYVQRGTVLGLADNTGNSSGPHLHFSLKHFGHGSPWMNRSDLVNPTPYFPDLFPAKFLVDVGGNVRKEPADTAPILRYLSPGATVQALDFGGPGGDWWLIAVDPPYVPTLIRGWFWQPGYKMRAVK